MAAPLEIRVATFNASLNRTAQGRLAEDLATGTNAQARQVAEIVQRVAPDILLVNEFDVDPNNPTLARDRFHDHYLAIPQNGQPALAYPYRYSALSNTGIPTGFDLDNNGTATTSVPPETASNATKDSFGNDCYGFGWFPGQYSFVVYSKYPILAGSSRSFRLFKWKDMPGAVIPEDYYTATERNVFRLSSKNHVALPIEIKPGQLVHLLASHPTPPSFDGSEDRNGRRNHDEIRLWADYISNQPYLRDDAGVTGGLSGAVAPQRFVILGDLNADPLDGDSFQQAIGQLRNHPLVNATPNPASAGGAQAAGQGGANANHDGDPAFDTADFGDFGSAPGNLRVDHVLPSKAGFAVTGSGVFWPGTGAAGATLVTASDHRLVWLDLTLTPVLEQSVRELRQVRANGSTVLTWKTQPGVTYRVEWSANLTDWYRLPAIPIVLNAAAQTAEATDTTTEPQRFYRVQVTLEE